MRFLWSRSQRMTWTPLALHWTSRRIIVPTRQCMCAGTATPVCLCLITAWLWRYSSPALRDMNTSAFTHPITLHMREHETKTLHQHTQVILHYCVHWKEKNHLCFTSSLAPSFPVFLLFLKFCCLFLSVMCMRNKYSSSLTLSLYSAGRVFRCPPSFSELTR